MALGRGKPPEPLFRKIDQCRTLDLEEDFFMHDLAAYMPFTKPANGDLQSSPGPLADFLFGVV